MFDLRTKKQLTTKYSPYYLMFGREARYPSEVPEEYLVKEDKVSKLVEREESHEGLKKQEAVFTEVKNNMETSQDKVRKRKIERGQEDNFQVGDQVLRRNVRQEQRKGGKLEDDWLGPDSILELEGEKAIVAKGTTKLQTNIDHLTHYFQPEERIPAKLQKLSDPSPLAGPQHTKTQTHIHSTQTPQVAPPSPSDCEAQRAPKDPELLIRQIWTGRRKHTLWCKFGPYKVYTENLMDLAPRKWLEGEESWRSNHRLLSNDVALGGNPQRFLEKVGPFQTQCGSWSGLSQRTLDTDYHVPKGEAVPVLGPIWGHRSTDRQMQRCNRIECTTCQMWYHLGCVGPHRG
ncbi:uncharacterized protein [Pseudochaenichthys georgianus]|uniref:uncharacterized protein n=1 Tax=Pseudochaenichthys georgianus TaxID=52239 RepID=UPI00146C4901|nr:uncharacterized protein LOC117463933 [Pseudochaenichthys georgianus]